MEFNYTIKEKTDIKSFLLKQGYSLTIINKLLLEKTNIIINGVAYTNNYNLVGGDTLKIVLVDTKPNIIPIDKDIQIIYEDEYFLVVGKPKNLATIPTIRHYNDNLASRVLNYYNKTNQNCGIHIVNRLDLQTFGIVVFAKNEYIHCLISKQKITKKYKCLVNGILENKSGEINQKIEKDGESIKRKVSPTGKEAITIYNVILEENGNSYLDIELKTGRTHQIRVHLSFLGHPLVGDILYGDTTHTEKDFYLCSYYLGFFFPLNNKQYEFKI